MSHPVFTVNNNEIIDSGAFRICVRQHANRFLLICVVIIERRLAAVRSIRRKELAMEAERILSDKQ